MATPNAFWDPINKKIEERHREEENLKSQQRASWLAIANDPKAGDDVRNWAWTEYSKSLNPGVRKKFGILQPLLGKIFGAQQRQPWDEKGPDGGALGIPSFSPSDVRTQENRPGDSSQITTLPNPNGLPAPPEALAQRRGPIPAPSPIVDTEASNRRELDFLWEKSMMDAAKQRIINESKPGTTGTRRNLQFKLPSGDIVNVQQDSKTGQYFTHQGDPYELAEGAQPYKAPVAGVRKEFYFKDASGTEHKIFQDSRTQQTFDVRGNPFTIPEDWEAIDEQAKLARIRGSYYGTGEYNSLVRSFKAQDPELTDDQAEAMAGVWVQEAAKRRIENIGVPRTTERPMVVGGEVRAVPFVSAPVPRPLAAPTLPSLAPPGAGATTSAPTQSGAPPAAPTGGGAPAPRTAPPAQTSPRPTPAAAVPSAGRVVGVPSAQYRAMLNDVRAVRAGAGQLFGDPNTPSIKGLVDYGDLADNSQSRERLGRALRLTFDGLNQASGGGVGGVGGEGFSLNVGGIGTWVGNQLGIPAAIAGQQARMMQEAIGALSPAEHEAYDATILSAEGIIGLRRLTGASPSQQSVRAIQEAMPVIGVNTIDTRQFYDRMERLAVEFAAGTRGIPTAGFDAETQKQIREINALPEKLAQRRQSAPKSAPRPAAPKVGDVQDGYRFKGGDPSKRENWESVPQNRK